MLSMLAALLFYGALMMASLAFIFSNRGDVELFLMPLEYSIAMPLYIALLAMFVLGLVLGLAHSMVIRLRSRQRRLRDARLIRQLERELSMKAQTHPKIGQS